MKKKLALALLVFAVMGTGVVYAEESGTMGDNITWVLDDNGVLTFTGEGAMPGPGWNPPWTEENVKKAVVSEGITEVGDNMFYECSNMESLELADSVTTLSNGGFLKCTSLKTIYVGKNFDYDIYFNGANALEAIYIDEENEKFTSVDGVVYSKDGTELIRYPQAKSGIYTPPETVTKIGGAAFSDCVNLTGVVITSGIVEIGTNAFYGCTGLTEVNIPDNVKIGEYLFYDCKNLKKATLPSGITELPMGTFEGCPSLEEFDIPEGVTIIPQGCFSGCAALKNVTIPSSVKEIRINAFSGCSSLEQIEIPESVELIYSYAFSGCKALKSIVIPKKTYCFGEKTFEYCTSLESAVIKTEAESLPIRMFSGCTALKEIVLPETLKALPMGIFSSCNALTSYTIPDGIEKIDQEAFAYCENLKDVTIPDTVTYIGKKAFYYVNAFTDVYYHGTKEQWTALEKDTGNDGLENATIHYLVKSPEIAQSTKVTDNGNGTFTVNVDIEGAKNLSDDTRVIIVLKKDSDLKGIGTGLVDKENGSKELTVSAEEADSATIFLWKSLESMEPVSSRYDIGI